MLRNFGLVEILVVLLLVIIFFGGKRLPQFTRDMTEALKDLFAALNESSPKKEKTEE